MVLTVELLSAFIANNSVRGEDLPGLILATHRSISGLRVKDAGPEVAVTERYVAIVAARKSLANRDVILSMIDGKPYRSLKRHLTGHDLSPDEYWDRFNLPDLYPMVAPGYSEERRAVAKRLGFGRRRPPPATEAAPDAANPPASGSPPARAKRKYMRREQKTDTVA